MASAGPETKTTTADWLKSCREAAWRRFREAEAPAKTVETWRRTSFKDWGLDRLGGSEAYPLKGLNGNAASAELSRKGVVLTSLEEASAGHAELISPLIGKGVAGMDFEKLETANLAMWREGVFLRVPEGIALDEPVHIRFHHDPARGYAFPRVLVVAEPGSRVTVVEEHVGAAGGPVASAAFSRVVVGRGAEVSFFYVQDLPKDAVHFWHQRAELGPDARLTHSSAIFGARLHKSELDVVLEGPGAKSELAGVLLGGGTQVFDPHTNQLHRASRTTSDLKFRTVLQDKARSIYTGLIRIEREAVDCEAYQSNPNLLLSEGARADSTPILEILPDAVACKHGASVGPVDPDEMFYLMSRGISEAEAKRMLVMGFFEPILEKLPIGTIRERLEKNVQAAIP